jgi:predicted Zn finger-like uncharacterized protein
VADSELRYNFACPGCAGSFSIAIDRIPPARARFTCPKCGKSMDFPSREEARVYVLLSPGADAGEVGAAFATVPAAQAAPPTAAAEPERTPAQAPAGQPPPAAPDAEKRYTVQKVGFEGESFDRRAIRILIRTGALDEGDALCLGDAAAVRADQMPDLKALFELRKTSRFTPPAVCLRHTEKLAHYVCASTGRPLCEGCAAERKYGGTVVRVCDHCNGSVRELPVEHA